jgi:hypothetical protein
MRYSPEDGDYFDLLDLLKDATDQASSLSERTCCMCGREPVKRASRFVVGVAPMPLCTRAHHDDDVIDELRTPSFTLEEVKSKMKGKKFLSERDMERFRAWMNRQIGKAAE